MITRREVYEEFKKYPPKVWNRYGPSGTNKQIMRTILTDHRDHAVQQARLIAGKFKGETITDTAKNVYDFLFNQIVYIKDTNGQDIRFPSALVRTGHGDCKSYSLFANSIFDALDVPYVYRFASYDINPTPTHVYSYVANRDGKIIVDPVWKRFDSQKPFTFKRDFTNKRFDMRIRSIQGHDNVEDNMNGFTPFGYENKDIGKAKKAAAAPKTPKQKGAGKAKVKAKVAKVKSQVKAKVKKVETKVKAKKDQLKKAVKTNIKKFAAGVNKVGKTAKKIGLTPVRAAFLSLILLNFRGLASKIKKVDQKNPKEIENLWATKFAGNYKQFKKELDKGAAKKPFLGAKKTVNGIEGIGVATEAIVALIAAATPLIVAFIGLLKKHGESPEELNELATITTEAYAEAGGNAAMDSYVDNAGSGSGAASATQDSYERSQSSGDNNFSPGAAAGDENTEGSNETNPGKPSNREKSSGNGIAIAALAAGALLLLSGSGKSMFK